MRKRDEQPGPVGFGANLSDAERALPRRRPLRDAFVVAGLSLAVGLIGVSWTAWRARTAQVEAIREDVMRLASAAAATVDTERHARLTSPLQMEGEDYAAALAPLLAIHHSLPSVTYLYTMVERSGQYYFVLDTSTALVQEPKTADLVPSIVMERYASPDPELIRAFREARAQANDEPHADIFGTWLTGYAPFFDADGRLAGVVGVDLSVETFARRLERIGFATGFGFVLVVLLAVGIGFTLWRAERRGQVVERRALADRAAAMDALARRERLLAATSTATRLLLAGDTDAESASRSLAALGEAAGADRVRLCRLASADGGDPQPVADVRVLQTWTRQGSSDRFAEPSAEEARGAAPVALDRLVSGLPVAITPDEGGTSASAPSSLILPIQVDEVPWGFVQLDACDAAHVWTRAEQRILAGTASILGGVERLRLAREEAEAGARAKSRFLAAVSHDIRTPMASVLGMTELLAKSDLPDELRSLAEGALSSSRALLRLLDDIVDLARLEAGRMEIRPVPFRVAALVADVLLVFSQEAARKGLALRHDVAESVPAELEGDVVRLRQLLFNLVGNAVKFTERGHVRLVVEAAANPDGLHEVTFVVEDTGPGIDPTVLPSLFEPFARGTNGAKRTRGAGLGLSICRQLVDRMQGRIAADSCPGEGSVFRVTLPLAEALAPSPEAAAEAAAAREAETAPLPPGPARPLADLRALVADDDPTLLELAAVVLGRNGCLTRLVRDGEEAVAAFTPGAFDVALIDVNMPGLDGPEVARRIRVAEADSAHRVPIIALTASVLDEERATCLSAGMDEILAKPYTNDQLVAVVARRTARAPA